MLTGCAKDGDLTDTGSTWMRPISGFKEKFSATGMPWNAYNWSSTPGTVDGNVIQVTIDISTNSTEMTSMENSTSGNELDVHGCLAF